MTYLQLMRDFVLVQTPFIVPGIGEPMGVGFFGDLRVSGNGYSSGSSSSLLT